MVAADQHIKYQYRKSKKIAKESGWISPAEIAGIGVAGASLANIKQLYLDMVQLAAAAVPKTVEDFNPSSPEFIQEFIDHLYNQDPEIDRQ